MADSGSILDHARPSGGAARGGAKKRAGPRADNVASPVQVLDEDSRRALAGLTTTPDECAEGTDRTPGAPCASRRVVGAILAFVAARPPAGTAAATGVNPASAPGTTASSASAPGPAAATLLPAGPGAEARAVRAAAAALGCAAESCVVAHPAFRRYAAEQGLATEAALALELETRFKAPGPRSSRELLSNYNIDETLRRWARVFPEFYPCPFAMMDFERNGDLFGSIDLPAVLAGRVAADLGPGFGAVRRPTSCFGCVLNTDSSSGPGKHWVAVFVDYRAVAGPWTIEYFNSAGNPPPRAVVRWSERARAGLAEYRQGLPVGQRGEVAAVPVTDMDHQESQTECGLYALFYIRRRLEGTPYTFFTETLVPDDAMTAFRAHVFRAAP